MEPPVDDPLHDSPGSRSLIKSFIALHAPVLVLDPEHRVRMVNPAAKVLLEGGGELYLGCALSSLPAGEPWRSTRLLLPTLHLGSASQTTLVESGGRTWEITISGLHPPLPDGVWKVLELHDVTEFLELYRRSESAQERLERVLSGASLGYWDWDVASGVVSRSPRCSEIAGLDPASVPSTASGWLSLVHPSDRPSVEAAAEALLQGRSDVLSLEYRVAPAPGRWVWVLDAGSVVARDSLGRPARIAGVLLDITARKSNEERVRQSEERFRTVADAAPALIFMTGRSGCLTYVNRGWLEFTGRYEEETIGLELASEVHEADRPRLEEALRKATEAGTALTIDVRLRRADGEDRWVAMSGSPLFSAEGLVTGFIVSGIDITARRVIATRLQETSDRLTTLIEALPDAVVLKDADGRWQMANEAAARLLGLSGEDWLGRTDQQLATLLPRQRETFEALSESDRRAKDKGQRHDSVDLIVEPSGLYRYFEASRVPLRGPSGDDRGMVLLGRNATERRIAEAELLLAASVFEESLDGIMITGKDRRILRVNRAFCRISGFSPEEVLGHTPSILRSGRHGPGFYAEMWKSIHSTGQWRGEIWNRRKNGEIYPEWLAITTVRDPSDLVTHYIGTFSDLADKKRIAEETARLKFEDPLTGLANRRRFEEDVVRAVSSGLGMSTACIFLDIEGLSRINNAHGYATGDSLLRVLARRIAASLEGPGTVARWEAGQFAILLTALPPEDAPRLAARQAERLRKVIAAQVEIEGSTLHVGGTMGIALHPDDGPDLPRLADLALADAKSRTPGRYSFHAEQMGALVRTRLSQERELRQALAAGHLKVHYQPLISASTGRLTGLEALLRWFHPDRGPVPPAVFIPVAEESGLILDVGRFVLDRTASQVAEWLSQEVDPGRIAINVSARQLVDPEFECDVMAVLRRHGLSPSRFTIEVTESVFVDEYGTVADVLSRLRQSGARIALDDFGTGFSSLARLRRLPIDILKIDRAFLHDVPAHRQNAALCRAILAMGRGLGLTVVAEGVENLEQAEFLKGLECDEFQGYLITPALPPAEVSAMLGTTSDS